MIREERIVKIITEHLGVDKSKVNEHTTLEDLGADSLDGVELVMAIEEEFGIYLTDDQAASFKTVRDVIIAVSKAENEA